MTIPLGQPIEATNPAAQALCAGIAAPAITFRPGGVRKANVYTTEPLLQQACTAAAGMDGPFPVNIDLSLASDTYTAAGNLNLGASSALVGLVNPATGLAPTINTAFTLTAPTLIRDLTLACTFTGQVFTTAPMALLVAGESAVTCAAGTTLYTANAPGFNVTILDDASFGDGANPCIPITAAGAVTVVLRGFTNLLANAFGATIPAGGTLQIFADPTSMIDSSYETLVGCTITVLGAGVNLPALPVDGTYELVVAGGVGTWTEGPPALPIGNGFYGLNVSGGAGSWVQGAPALPGNGTYQLVVSGGVGTWTTPAAVAQQVLVYPGNFASWAALVAAAVAVTNPTIVVQGGNHAVPAGAWNLDSGSGYSIVALGYNGTIGFTPPYPPALAFANGASLTSLPAFIDGVTIYSQSNSPIYSGTASSFGVRNCALAVGTASSTGDMFHFTSASVAITLDNVTAETGNGSPPYQFSGTGTALNVLLKNGCFFQGMNFHFPSAAAVLEYDDNSSIRPGVVAASTTLNYINANSAIVTMALTGSSPFSNNQGHVDVLNVTAGSPPTGAVTLVVSLSLLSQGHRCIVDLSTVNMSGVTSLTIECAGLTTTSPTPAASAIYQVWSDGISYINLLNMTPTAGVSEGPTTTSGTTTIVAGIYGYAIDTSGGATPTVQFPAAPTVGDKHRVYDVGGAILDGSGNPLHGATLSGNGKNLVNPDTGILVASMPLSRNYWSGVFTYVAKGIWSAD
jgi:hypothetical protein